MTIKKIGMVATIRSEADYAADPTRVGGEMIFRRKPNSDERDFSDTAESHVAENIGPPQGVPVAGLSPLRAHQQLGRYTQPGRVRYAFSLGRAIGGQRWSDCAIDIDWQDIIDMIEFLANDQYPPAAALLQFVRDPEGFRRAL